MKLKKIALLSCVVLLMVSVFSGCNGIGKVKKMGNKFVDYYNEDEKYDRRSIFYENGKLSFVKDKLDDKHILDGRAGEYHYVALKLKNGCSLFYPETDTNKAFLNSKDNVIKDDENEFIASNSNRFISVKKMSGSWDENKEQFIKNLEDKDVIDATKDAKYPRLDKYVFYYGMVTDNNGRELLGMHCLFQKKGVIYNFVFGRTGNFEDIKIDGESIIQ